MQAVGRGLRQFVQQHAHALILSGVAVVYLAGYLLYSRDVDYSLPSYDACIADKPASAAIATKFSELDNLHPASDDLLKAIDALPKLDAAGGLPDIHTAMRKYKEAGIQDDLFDTLQNLSKRPFEELFRADDLVRNQVRDILFLWANVDETDAASRGPFIDARELEFLEKMKDKPFLQDDLYPNPAPLDALQMRGEFNEAWNHYYGLLLRQVAAQEMFGTPSPADDAPLTPAALDKLSHHAADFKTADEKAAYWTNVVRVTGKSGGAALDPLIRASAPGLSFDNILSRLHDNPGYKNGRPTDRQGRAIGFNVQYQPEKLRLTCYGFIKEPDAVAQGK